MLIPDSVARERAPSAARRDSNTMAARHCRFNCRKSQPFGRASLRVRRHEATLNHEHGCRLVSTTFGIKSLAFNRNKRSVATAKSWRGRFAMHDSTGVWPPTLGTADVHATRLRFQVLHLSDSHHPLSQRSHVCLNVAPGDEAHSVEREHGQPQNRRRRCRTPQTFYPIDRHLTKGL